MSNIVMPLSGTFRPQGGMTGSILKKASMLAEIGHDVQLVTFRYRMDQYEHQEYLVSHELISPRVEIVNFFESLDSLQSTHYSAFPDPGPIQGTKMLVQKKSLEESRYFNLEGDLLFTEQVTSSTYPSIIRRYFDLDRCVMRLEDRDLDGTLRRVCRYVPQGSELLSESYIGRGGAAYLSIWYRRDQSVISVINHTDWKRRVNSDFTDLAALQSSWFKDLVSEIPQAIVLIDDPYVFGTTREALALAEKSILTLHNNTFVRPDDPTSEINNESRRVLEGIDCFQSIVTSTTAQRDDLNRRYPDRNIVTIPQVVEIPDPKITRGIEHDPNLLVYVGRLDPPKQLLELLDAIPVLFDSFPSLRFEIYGEGSQQSEISEKIDLLGLGSFVTLMGRTETAFREFAKANLSVLASRYEGFGVALAEAMAVGTPVVAFDCRYGPGDMIDDNVSGRLIPAQDFTKLVEALIELQADQELVESMRAPAIEKISKLCGRSDNMGAWAETVDSGSTLQDDLGRNDGHAFGNQVGL